MKVGDGEKSQIVCNALICITHNIFLKNYVKSVNYRQEIRLLFLKKTMFHNHLNIYRYCSEIVFINKLVLISKHRIFFLM